jgi:hypothetical protein
MIGADLKLAIYIHGLQCDNFTVLSVCVPPFSSVETTPWISNHDYIIIFLSSSATAAALTLNELCKLHPVQPFSYP